MEGLLSSSGYGYGDGSGSGSGYGYGYGDGSGSGDGYGYGYGSVVGVIGEHKVTVVKPFGILVIGCQTRTIAEWKANWRAIAKENRVKVSDVEVEALLAILSK